MDYFESIRDKLDNIIWINNSKYFKQKDDRVIIKLYDESDVGDKEKFLKSIIVPTVMFPLNKPNDFKVFTYKNTIHTTDENIIRAFDKSDYVVGHCYNNANDLSKRLIKEGVNVKTYAGWLFVEENDYPVHHCWCVVESTEGDILLDLADDFIQRNKYFHSVDGIKDVDDYRELQIQFYLEAKKVPHSVRCEPVGQCSPSMVYIGCECDSEQAKDIYRDLLREYPNHCSDSNTDENGLNKLQKMMVERGLIK